MKQPLIEFKDFTFRYKSQTEATLHDINLTIYEHQKVLILGASGSGKSTLAHCINGLIPFSFEGEIKGSCQVAGIETINASIFDLSKQVGTVLQDSDAQFVGLSVGEDIAFSLENDNVLRKDMLTKVLDAATVVGMQDFLAAVPYRLSGGQKQKVSLAGVIHEDVQILLFDEPLASLDPAMGKTAIELIDDLYKLNQKTVIIIEHRLEDVLHRPIDRVILMDEGRIVADTTPDELLVSDLLGKYGIREPLYLSALKHAGCEVLASDGPCDVFTMNLSRFEDQLKAFEEKYVASTDKQFHQKLIEVNHVSFAYDKVKVLKNVSFDIYGGEKIAIIGKNGAGKSTMAKMLCGVIRPDEGQIKVNDQNYLQMTIKELGEMIGYVMQNPNQMLVKDIIKDEVGLALKLRKMTEEQIDERVDEVLKTCNLYSMRNWPVSAVSYGQRKRITIAAIMALKPTIMLLDEPTAGQDYRHYTEILSFLEELHEKMNLTILFITHDMHLAIEYTDRAIVFADGECIRDDQVYRVLSDPSIIERANLKQTSLYTLAHRIGRTPEALIDQFITLEREGKR